MKFIIHISILFFSTSTLAQLQKTTLLRLSSGDCRLKEARSWHGADTICFYRLPEDTLAYKVIPAQYNQWPIKISKVPIGSYRLSYKNNFGQEVTEQIMLEEETFNAVVICPDKLTAYPQNTLAKFQDKDSIIIFFQSLGCFHSEMLKLGITKENDQYVARLYDASLYYTGRKRKPEMHYKTDGLLKTVMMTNRQLQDFIRFENELNFAKNTGCTTTDWYEVSSRYLNLSRSDGSCSWGGFRFLQESLFGKK